MKRPLFPLIIVSLLAACSQSEAPATTQSATAAAAASTSTASQAAPDASKHVLTRSNVDAFFAVQRNFMAAVEADPSLDPAINISEEDSAAYAERLQATPALHEAVRTAGISASDYALTSEALLSALMAVGALDAGLLQELPEGLSPQNVEFVRRNKAEIDAGIEGLRG